jgi:hypothetical protein
MPVIPIGLMRPVPSIVPSDAPCEAPSDAASGALCDIPEMTDDECLVRLAQVIADHDSDHLDEVARLIGRLAVPIE